MVSEQGDAGQGELSNLKDQKHAFIAQTDAPLFREQSAPRVHAALVAVQRELTPALEERQPEQIRDLLISSSDTLARSILDASDDQDIDTLSSPELGIGLRSVKSGKVSWARPEDPQGLETELVTELAVRFCNGDIDSIRLAKSVYLLQILNHKYINGNGRVARSLKAIIEKADNRTSVTTEDTKKLLGIEEDAGLSSSEEDSTRIIAGLGYFGEENNLMTYYEVMAFLKNNDSLIDPLISELSRRAGRDDTQMKKDFIRYMVLDSDISLDIFANSDAHAHRSKDTDGRMGGNTPSSLTEGKHHFRRLLGKIRKPNQ
ncbi:MAG TPA: hypothetical protein VND99_03955 [Candidatus Acidoferrales bacterium]|nr:hypothetical protein [Candidatus Acidoferrales bacterium]